MTIYLTVPRMVRKEEVVRESMVVSKLDNETSIFIPVSSIHSNGIYKINIISTPSEGKLEDLIEVSGVKIRGYVFLNFLRMIIENQSIISVIKFLRKCTGWNTSQCNDFIKEKFYYKEKVKDYFKYFK